MPTDKCVPQAKGFWMKRKDLRRAVLNLLVIFEALMFARISRGQRKTVSGAAEPSSPWRNSVCLPALHNQIHEEALSH